MQGNVDQDQSGIAARASDIFEDYLRMTRQAIARALESCRVAGVVDAVLLRAEDRRTAERSGRSRDARVPISSAAINWSGSRRQGTTTRRSWSARTADRRRLPQDALVPFGEYVPLKRCCSLRRRSSRPCRIFAGDAAVLMPAGRPFDQHGDLLRDRLSRSRSDGSCRRQRAADHDHQRRLVRRTSAPWQHFAQAAMRAIEQGRYLVRSANTGISGIVDPYGRVLVQRPVRARRGDGDG